MHILNNYSFYILHHSHVYCLLLLCISTLLCDIVFRHVYYFTFHQIHNTYTYECCFSRTYCMYCMPKNSWPISIVYSQYKFEQDYLHIWYIFHTYSTLFWDFNEQKHWVYDIFFWLQACLGGLRREQNSQFSCSKLHLMWAFFNILGLCHFYSIFQREISGTYSWSSKRYRLETNG